MKSIDFYKEFADLLNKYRPIKEQLDFRRDDEDWIQLRVPYAFMIGDKDFSYELYLYKCKICGVHDYTNQEKEADEKCDMCNEGLYEQIIIQNHNDWVNYPK